MVFCGFVKEVKIIPDIVDFLALIETDTPCGEVRDTCFKQCVFNIRKMCSAANEDSDVAIFYGTLDFLSILTHRHHFTIAFLVLDMTCDKGSFISGFFVLFSKQALDATICLCRTGFRQGFIRHLKFISTFGIHQTGEKIVDESNNCRQRTEVLSEGDSESVVFNNFLSRFLKDTDIRAAKSVNALFRIADDEEICAFEFVCKKHYQFILEFIRILIFVYHVILVSRYQFLLDLFVIF